ncbi:MAG TPA: BTAD domain-containing putative transcriptional regulator [Pedococcus sp.]
MSHGDPFAPIARVALLGPVRLVAGADPVHLTPSERTLLAGIALREGRPVSADALVEWVWGDSSHASPRNRVQALVSGLRRKVGGPTPLVVTEGTGYRLAADVGCDHSEWVRLRVEVAALPHGDARRRELLHRAGDLVDGLPLEGCIDSPAVAVHRQHLEEQRLELIGERVDADIAAGSYEGLVAELTTLTRAHPFHETFMAQLVEVLALTGRQADALQAYRDAYSRLDEELGVAPGARLDRVHQRVLRGELSPGARSAPPSAGPATSRAPARQDGAPGEPTARAPLDQHGGPETHTDPGMPGAPGLPAVPTGAAGRAVRPSPLPSPRTVPRSLTELVGRDAELAEIDREAERATRRPAVVSITGLGGVGKSSLAIEAAHLLRDRFPDGSLYLDCGSQTGQAGPGSVLELFLRLLGVAAEAIPAGVDARAGLFRSVLDDRRVLIVLDDVPDGFDVSDLLPARPTSMAILTSRRSVADAFPTCQIRLRSLAADDSLELLGRLLGGQRVGADASDVAALVGSCGGLPLLLKLVAQRLARRPDVPLGQAARALAEEITGRSEAAEDNRALQTALGLAEAPLPDSVRRLLHDVSALSLPRTSRWVFAALAGSEAQGDLALDQLVDASFVDPVLVEGRHPQYQIHDLVRQHARHSAATEQRSSFAASEAVAAVSSEFLRLTRAYAAALPMQLLPPPPDEQGRPAGAVADHGSGVGDVTPEQALRFFATEHENLLICARDTARSHPGTAWRLLALSGGHAVGGHEPGMWTTAADEVRRALPAHGRDGERGLVHLDLVEALLRHEAADSAASVPLAARARRSLHLDGDLPAALAAAVVLGRAHRARGERAAAEEALGWAARSCRADTPATTRGYIALAWGSLEDDYDRLHTARDHLTEAHRQFAGTLDWSGLATSQFALARVLRRLGQYAEGLPLCESALELVDRIGDQNGRTAVLDTRADLLVHMGHHQAALGDAREALDRATLRRDGFMRHRAQRTLGRALAGLGRLSEAEDLMRGSAAGFDQLGRPLSLAATLRDLGRVLQLQGRPQEAREVFLRERDCLVESGVDDLSEIDGLIARLDARHGGRPAVM